MDGKDLPDFLRAIERNDARLSCLHFRSKNIYLCGGAHVVKKDQICGLGKLARTELFAEKEDQVTREIEIRLVRPPERE